MIRSMTGFGAVERESSRGGTLVIEIRTENHRHFHSSFRTPVEAEKHEQSLTRILKEKLSRGHVRFRLDYQVAADASGVAEVDEERVAAYLNALEEIERKHVRPRLGIGRRFSRHLFGGPDLGLLVRMGDVLRPAADARELDSEELFAAARDAVDAVVTAREREGEALRADLVKSIGAIQRALAVVVERAPLRLVEERDRLEASINELIEDASVDEDRIAREIAFLAERWDINEEVVRLESHLDEFGRLLHGEEAVPVGKRLGFWVQEILREANTIGSKANDSEIARRVVDMKTAIEKIREQVENVE